MINVNIKHDQQVNVWQLCVQSSEEPVVPAEAALTGVWTAHDHAGTWLDCKCSPLMSDCVPQTPHGPFRSALR